MTNLLGAQPKKKVYDKNFENVLSRFKGDDVVFFSYRPKLENVHCFPSSSSSFVEK